MCQFQLMPTVMSPDKLDMNGGLLTMQKWQKQRKREIGDPDKPEDDPCITEIRDRIVQIVHEMDEMKMLDQ